MASDHSHDHAHVIPKDAAACTPKDRIVGASISHSGTDSMSCCGHDDKLIERYIAIYMVGGLLVAVTTFSRWLGLHEGEVVMIPAVIGAVMLAIPIFAAALREVRTLRPSSGSLTAMAILAALAMGAYETAGWLAFILLVFEQVVRRTASGAQRAIQQLVGLTPTPPASSRTAKSAKSPSPRSRSARSSASAPARTSPSTAR